MGRSLFKTNQRRHLDRTCSSHSCESISFEEAASDSILSHDTDLLSLSELVADEKESDSLQLFMNSTLETSDRDLLDINKDRHRIALNQAQFDATTYESISKLFDSSFESSNGDLLELKQNMRVRQDKQFLRPIRKKNSSSPRIQGRFNSSRSAFSEKMAKQYFPHVLLERIDSIQSIEQYSEGPEQLEEQLENKLIESVCVVDGYRLEGIEHHQQVTPRSVCSTQGVKHSVQGPGRSPSNQRNLFSPGTLSHFSPENRSKARWRNGSTFECKYITEKSSFSSNIRSEDVPCEIHAPIKSICSTSLVDTYLSPSVNGTLLDHDKKPSSDFQKCAAQEDAMPKLPTRSRSPSPDSRMPEKLHPKLI